MMSFNISGVTPVGVLSYLFFFAYIFWQLLLRLQKLNSASEPPILPYWIPGVGHTLSLLFNFEETLTNARKHCKTTLTPFTIVLAGRKTYVVLDPKLTSQTYKNTSEASYDVFVETVMIATGLSKPARDKMWSVTVEETKLAVPNSIRAWVRHGLQRIPMNKSLYAKFTEEVHEALSVDFIPRPSPYSDNSVQKKVGKAGRFSLLDWTGDTLVTAFSNALFGHACLDNYPPMLDAFHRYNRRAWMVIFRLPKYLSGGPHDARNTVLTGLTQYFDLPTEKRMDSPDCIRRSEAEMRSHGISSEDIAAAMSNLYWAVNGNTSMLTFWLLCHILYDPALLSDIREESEKAFVNGKQLPPDVSVIRHHCPKLHAAYYEALRMHSGSSIFRRVTKDTVLGGYTLKQGADIMIPHHQLHIDPDYWGEDADQFNIHRFLNKPEAVKMKALKPFGGGVTQCPGRHIARETLLCYIAIAVQRYDFEIVGGAQTQRFPQLETDKPNLGITAPLPGEDVDVIVTSRV